MPPLRSRRPVDVPVERIAAELEALTTARSEQVQVIGARPRDRVLRWNGLDDFAANLWTAATEIDGAEVEHLTHGGRVHHRLSPEEQRRTGRIWRVEGAACPYLERHRDQVAGAVRTIAKPVAHTVEREPDGEELHRYALLLRPRPKEAHPVAADLREHLRLHGTDRLTCEYWLDADGLLRAFREHYSVPRHRRREGVLTSVTIDYWDLGIPLALRPPAPDEILPPEPAEG